MANNSSENYFNTEEFRNNLKLYEETQKAGESCMLGSEELSDIAEYYYEAGMLKKAKEAAEYATSLYPEASSPMIFLARFYLNVKKDNDAARTYIKKITDRDSVEYYTLIIEYFLAKGKKEKAKLAADKGEFELEDDEDMQYYTMDVAHLFIDYKMLDDAKSWAMKVKDKKSDDYLKLKARIATESEKYSEAIDILEKLLDKNPFSVELWNLLSVVQISCDKYQDAATSSEYAIAINDKSNDAFLNQGNAYFKMCNYEKALKAYGKFSELNDSELGEIFKARCYFCMQKPEEALTHLKIAEKRCTENKTNLIDIYKDMAIVYGWLGESFKAYQYINRLKDNNYADPELFLIEGGVLLGMNKFDEANSVFTIGYDKSDNKKEYLFQIAVSFFEHGFDKAAYLVLKEIFKVEPQRTRGLAYLAITSNYLGLKDEFLKYLKMSVEKNPDEAKAVLGEMFPQGMEPYDYLEYVNHHLNKL